MARYTSTPALCGFWKIWNFLFELCLTFVRGIGKTNQKVLRVCEKQKTYHFCEVLLESENFRRFKTSLGLRRFFCVQRFASKKYNSIIPQLCIIGPNSKSRGVLKIAKSCLFWTVNFIKIEFLDDFLAILSYFA